MPHQDVVAQSNDRPPTPAKDVVSSTNSPCVQPIQPAPPPSADDAVPPTNSPLKPDQGETTSKSSKRAKKYGCRMCDVRVDTAQELKTHHSNTHGIMYCKHCTKAFNNQLSLTRHEYEHKSRPYVCKTCGEDFPFESQFNTHKLTHSERRKHACTYTNCEK